MLYDSETTRSNIDLVDLTLSKTIFRVLISSNKGYSFDQKKDRIYTPTQFNI